jgi:DNA-binding MarR family transcriptional regulator
MARALDDFLRASRALDRMSARTLGLTEIEARAVRVAFERQGVGPTALARALGMTTASATVLIDRLCRQGHFSRLEHPNDRRRVRILLSYRTTRTLLSERSRHRADIGTAADALTASERRAVMRYLGTVAMLWRRGIVGETKKHRANTVPFRSQDEGETT